MNIMSYKNQKKKKKNNNKKKRTRIQKPTQRLVN